MTRTTRLSMALILCITVLAVSGCGGDDAKTVGSTSSIPPTTTPAASPDATSEEGFDESLWQTPPMENRPYVRWWWPGGDVEEQQLESDLSLLKEAGFGGVEVQPLLLGFTPEEIEDNPDIRTVGTPHFFEKLRVAAREARKLGMGFDVTLGSGWSTGVPDAAQAAEKQLLMSSREVTGPTQYEGPLPIPEPPAYRERVNAIMNVVGPYDEPLELVAVTAAQVAEGSSEIPVLQSLADITQFVHNGDLTWDVPEGTWRIFAFYQNNTSHAPVGAAYPGTWHDALIVDHLDSSGAQKVIDDYGDPLLDALGEYAPDTIFVDSFELVGELPWTTSFLDRYERLKGYDVTPYLPLLFQANGESKYTRMTDLMSGRQPTPAYASADDAGIRVREDYEEVRGTLFLEEFFEPIIRWGRSNGVDLRIQAHGGWADYLDAYEMADIPESEALFAHGVFDFLKLASSGAHISGGRFTGSESFITLANDPHALTLEEFYRLGGRAFSAGINRMVYHGFPYSLTRQKGEGWYPLSGEPGTLRAGPIPFTSWMSQRHPVWPDLPSFNEYLARLSYALSCGTHSADIAWLWEGWEFPDNPAGSGEESDVSLALKRSGFVYDRISRRNLANAVLDGSQFAVGAARYKALLISALDVATPELMASVEMLADAGIPVVVVGDLPSRAPGFADHEKRDAATREIADRLRSKVIFALDESSAGTRIRAAGIEPALTPSDGSEMVFSLEHRKVAGGDILMLFNESDRDRTQELDCLLPAEAVQVLDPQTGNPVIEPGAKKPGNLSVEATIPAGRAVILIVRR